MRAPLLAVTEVGRGRGEIQGGFPHPKEREGSFPEGLSQHCCGPSIVLGSIYRVCRDSELPYTHPLPNLGTSQPILFREAPGAVFDLGDAGGNKPLLGERSWALAWCLDLSFLLLQSPQSKRNFRNFTARSSLP